MNDSPSPTRRLAIGIALMASASLAIPVVDGIAKLLGATHSPVFVAWARYVASSLIVVSLTAGFYRVTHDLRQDLPANLLRTVLIVGAMTCFFFAITRIPLATAFGGYFLGPVIAALAAPLLGERLSAGRLAAAALGLAGAILVVRPGAEPSLGALLAVASGALFAGYLITTRIAVVRTPPIDALRFQCVAGALLLTPFALTHWSWPSGDELLLIAAMGALSTLCHFMVIAAFRYAEVGVLSPLVYLELVTATLIGLLVFAELPDLLAFAGIGCIVLGGWLVWRLERAKGSEPSS
ncbi:MAG: DMT family transporter [Alphaproteobacteria bacterium]|nr:DMT family transporter [Alphaproteobacteria bacterium]MCW5741394.1 DMT family transporter [Alphaproteobacteria bacterium]